MTQPGNGVRERHERVIVPAVRVRGADDELARTLAAIRADLELASAFPPEVEQEAKAAVDAVELPDMDLTAVPFVTIDPAGATDLDQAMYLERTGDSYRVRYAIADVPAFVRPGGAIDAEARERGQTLYAPDGRIPLHPILISEDAASLLPDRIRGAYVWTFDVDAHGTVTSTALVRARIRSRRQYSYDEVQALVDAGAADESLSLLPELGEKLIARAIERGGATLDRPDEEVVEEAGRYELVRRRRLPVESYNAQLSLMTGMAAATIMLEHGLGILRTMPMPDEETLAAFRVQVASLGCPWPRGQSYGEYLRGLRRDEPLTLAVIHAAAALFRGAGYTAFDGESPADPEQAAVAAPYAHATAPLRRLVDRFVLVTCEALLAGRDVPTWVRDALPTLPKIMSRSDGLASRLERASVDAIEAALLSDRVGEVFTAVVIKADESGGIIQLTDPLVTAAIEGTVTAGDTVSATLVMADIATGTTRFRA
jgi:VacB/RNase II family 3'-5' exoribonuclease